MIPCTITARTKQGVYTYIACFRKLLRRSLTPTGALGSQPLLPSQPSTAINAKQHASQPATCGVIDTGKPTDEPLSHTEKQHAARCNDYAHPGLAHCILRDTQAMPNALRIANTAFAARTTKPPKRFHRY
ncbi:hypothetical protein LOK85_12245 [Xylella fastidiosa subsp. multiplex]|uniref:hypothetical protein n=1 Tax=Xylella fastidiosa TaxID=2371 RepID=UPI00234D07AE|nr:hypothetical protein [Xylella fastidiosa]MDC6416645.1 hypothetical protein [Xylella fastidiosa subsp. multiplex]